MSADLYCEKCARPMSEHQTFGDTCQNGEAGGPFVLMDSERAREIHVMRRKARATSAHADFLQHHTSARASSEADGT